MCIACHTLDASQYPQHGQACASKHLEHLEAVVFHHDCKEGAEGMCRNASPARLQVQPMNFSGSALRTIWMVLLKDRCSTLSSLLRHRAKLQLHVLKAAEGQHTVLVLKQVSHWHAEVL